MIEKYHGVIKTLYVCVVQKARQSVDVEKWLSGTISIFRKYILTQDIYSNKELIFEFWSTGGFIEDALIKLNQAKKLLNIELNILEKRKY